MTYRINRGRYFGFHRRRPRHDAATRQVTGVRGGRRPAGAMGRSQAAKVYNILPRVRSARGAGSLRLVDGSPLAWARGSDKMQGA